MRNLSRRSIKSSFLVFGFLSLFFFNGLSALAQETDFPEGPLSAEDLVKLGDLPRPASSDFILLATVNIYDAVILSQDGGNVNVSFTLSNREGVQPDITYGARLIRLAPSGEALSIAGTFPAKDRVALRENENLKRTFMFTVPDFLPAGEYGVELWASNSSGMNLAFAPAGTITIVSGSAAVITEDCFIAVSGEAPAKRYALDEGVDIASDESLELTCRVSNAGHLALELSPSFITYRRNIGSGILVEATAVPADMVRLAPRETKTFSAIVPKASFPQAYDARMILSDQDGRQISNEIIVHYVLRGASGTIQNVLLDKDAYVAGETAIATITFSGSADAFPEARGLSEGTLFGGLGIEAVLKNTEGAWCSKPVKQSFGEKDLLHKEISLPVIAECEWPIVDVRLTKISDNAILDEISVSLVPADPVPTPETQRRASSPEGFWSPESMAFAGIAFVLGGILMVFIVKLLRSKKNGATFGILFFIIGAGWLLAAGTASADTIYTPEWGLGGLSMTYNLNKSSYVPGDTMVASVSGSYIQCTNKYRAVVYLYVKPNATEGYSAAPKVERIFAVAAKRSSEQSWLSRLWNKRVIPVVQASAYWAGYSTSKTFTVQNSWNPVNPAATFWFHVRQYHKGRYIGQLNAYRDIPYSLSLLPSVTFSAAPNPVPYNTPSTLTWSATNATSCTAGGDWSGVKATSGSESTGNLMSSKTYTLYCTGPYGDSPVQSVTVNLALPSVDVKINGSDGPLTLTKGDSKNISWNVTGADSCTATSSDGWSGDKPVPTGSELGVVNATSDHTLACTGPGGMASDTVSITAVCTPVTGIWGVCNCTTETKTRTNTAGNCSTWVETGDCDNTEKNACRNFNWKEVEP